MTIQEAWERALSGTHITRPRVQGLLTFEATRLPYIFLAESLVNRGDTVVRKGEVVVEKPFIILPSHLPQFEGFEFEEERFSEDFLASFFMIRGIEFPSLKYNNKVDSLDIFEGSIEKAREHYGNLLQRQEDVATGLITGFEDVWPFSVLIFVGSQIAKSADGDLKRMLEERRRKSGFNSLS
jgi:hypothetical protein